MVFNIRNSLVAEPFVVTAISRLYSISSASTSSLSCLSRLFLFETEGQLNEKRM